MGLSVHALIVTSFDVMTYCLVMVLIFLLLYKRVFCTFTGSSLFLVNKLSDTFTVLIIWKFRAIK